jgi:hypothetical protein
MGNGLLLAVLAVLAAFGNQAPTPATHQIAEPDTSAPTSSSGTTVQRAFEFGQALTVSIR